LKSCPVFGAAFFIKNVRALGLTRPLYLKICHN
jgi:hypothetical protein